MTPDQIESTRELLAALPEDERPILARAAAEFLRLHEAVGSHWHCSSMPLQQLQQL